MIDCIRAAALLFILMSGSSFANVQEKHDLSFHVLREDATTTLSVESVCCDELKSHFSVTPVQQFQSGYGGTTIWLKIEGVPAPGLLQFSPILDRVTLFTRTKDSEEWQTHSTGDTLPNKQRSLASPFMALPVSAHVDMDNIYARIIQPTAVSIRVSHWDPPAFHAMQESDKRLKIFLLGCICSIIFYNAIVSLLVRDVAFLLNAICISALVITALYLSGYGVFYLWGPWFYLSNLIFVFSMWLAVASGAAFLFYFIRAPHASSAGLWPIFIAPVLSSVSLSLLILFQAPYWMMNIAALSNAGLFFFCITPIIFLKAFAGESKPKIILVPLIFAMLPGLILMALVKIAGINPFGLGENTLELTLAAEAVLFSLALAARIRASETERLNADLLLLKLGEENSARVLLAQDMVRKRLAKELHDGVGQEMLILVSGLRLIAKENESSAVGDRLREIVSKSASVMHNLRRVSQDMHPASIEHIGLLGTIEGLVAECNGANAIEFYSELTIGDTDINQKAQIHLVRIIQECLSNIVKHSKATHCYIQISIEDTNLCISIEDDGIGLLDQAKQTQSEFGLGLTSIAERVRSMNGEWNMQNASTGGLKTTILIPLRFIQINAVKN